MSETPEKVTIGWREWISIPSLGIRHIKVKVDTGAKTSALHAYDFEFFKLRDQEYVRFRVPTLQRESHHTVLAEAPLIGVRNVKSSGGHQSTRPVITAILQIGPYAIETELTLAARDSMGFRMLLGRDAVRKLFLIDPSRSFLVGKKRRKRVK